MTARSVPASTPAQGTKMGRWDRLAADLASAGIEASVTALPYTESVSGRVRHGVTRSIMLRHPQGGTVDIEDGWWAKNPDVWTGWQVIRTGADSIVRGRPTRTKRRSEVVAAVRGLLTP